MDLPYLILQAAAEVTDDVRGDPLMALLSFGAAGFLAYLWWEDYQKQKGGQEVNGAIPGATPWTKTAIIVGVVGALILTALETAGEYALGIVDEQSTLAWYFIFAMIGAGVLEEVMFRGFLIVLNKGAAALWASIIGFSLLFGLLHDFLWTLDMPEEAAAWEIWRGSFSLNLTTKGFFSFANVVAFSIFMYYLRVAPFNPGKSLLPCMIAHASGNVAVYLVKLVQGYIAF